MKILLIEDEPLAAQRLQKMVQELLPEAVFLDTLDSIETATNYLIDNTLPDLILIDIQLADGVSFEIFDHVNITCPVIFTTAFDEFAIKALRLGAVDYLLKPIKKDELETALQRLLTRQNPTVLPEVIREHYPTQRFMVKIGNAVKVIDYQDVNYFFSQEKITFAVLGNGKKYPINPPLDKLETMLGKDFFRANRQFIVSRNAIVAMQTHSKSRLRLTLQPTVNEEVIVSTERTKDLKKWLVE
jgi:DNA-binding LytR/AlgR family response regulator